MEEIWKNVVGYEISMKTDRVDLFIKNGSVIKDTNVIVKEK